MNRIRQTAFSILKTWLCPLFPKSKPFSLCTVVYACSVTQLCPTLCDPMDCCPPGSSVHGILQARILEWVAIPSSRGSSWLRDWTNISCISCTGRQILYHCSTWEAPLHSWAEINLILWSDLHLWFPLTLRFTTHFSPQIWSSCSSVSSLDKWHYL